MNKTIGYAITGTAWLLLMPVYAVGWIFFRRHLRNALNAHG